MDKEKLHEKLIYAYEVLPPTSQVPKDYEEDLKCINRHLIKLIEKIDDDIYTTTTSSVKKELAFLKFMVTNG